MDIDYKILDKIREYYSEELSEADSAEVERLIRSDDDYALHNRLFQAAGKGIKEAVDGPRKEWMRELDRKGPSEEENATLEALKKNDGSFLKTRTLGGGRFYLARIAAALLLILTAALGYFGWQQWRGPVAETSAIEEDEALLGSTGATVSREVDVYVFSPETKGFEPVGEKRTVLARQSRKPGMAYIFLTDTLLLLVENPEIFADAPMRWLEKEVEGITKTYLFMDGQAYALDKDGARPMPLQETQDEEAIELMQQR